MDQLDTSKKWLSQSLYESIYLPIYLASIYLSSTCLFIIYHLSITYLSIIYLFKIDNIIFAVLILIILYIRCPVHKSLVAVSCWPYTPSLPLVTCRCHCHHWPGPPSLPLDDPILPCWISGWPSSWGGNLNTILLLYRIHFFSLKTQRYFTIKSIFQIV